MRIEQRARGHQGRKETVARPVDLPPAVACEHTPNDVVMFLEKLAPPQVADFGDAFG